MLSYFVSKKLVILSTKLPLQKNVKNRELSKGTLRCHEDSIHMHKCGRKLKLNITLHTNAHGESWWWQNHTVRIVL